jgi:hypothetical protein
MLRLRIDRSPHLQCLPKGLPSDLVVRRMCEPHRPAIVAAKRAEEDELLRVCVRLQRLEADGRISELVSLGHAMIQLQ